jgi:hypothetical protein
MTGHLGGLCCFVQRSEKHIPHFGSFNVSQFFAFLISAIKMKKLGNKAVDLLHFGIKPNDVKKNLPKKL